MQKHYQKVLWINLDISHSHQTQWFTYSLECPNKNRFTLTPLKIFSHKFDESELFGKPKSLENNNYYKQIQTTLATTI